MLNFCESSLECKEKACKYIFCSSGEEWYRYRVGIFQSPWKEKSRPVGKVQDVEIPAPNSKNKSKVQCAGLIRDSIKRCQPLHTHTFCALRGDNSFHRPALPSSHHQLPVPHLSRQSALIVQLGWVPYPFSSGLACTCIPSCTP